MKKVLILLALTMILSGCGKVYWVGNEKDIDKEPAVRQHVNYLQNEKPDRKGFKSINIAEGNLMVVVSTGTNKLELEAVDVEILDDETIITVREVEADSDKINPYILIGLERKNGKLKVVNEDGEQYEIGF
ncbi:hypothetical protein MHZ92_10640 [Sporosarcina sp. ACRSL]|uniref:hypothetical protein n=1 Tax=Sporosarcina sp. ACRSL TaxID=2918215 RepID=UPI001EF6DDAA|nr:hypothetical protein [Sporosarcina sp. ACRSL]MCG7344595.1 hypothetical protein [Sporosarcina sp. ACRSL]